MKYFNLKYLLLLASFTLIPYFAFSQTSKQLAFHEDNLFNSYIRLNELATVVGIVNGFSRDTVSIREHYNKIKKHDADMQKYLQRAAEYFVNGDNESTIFYIKKVDDFDDIDLNNFKYVIYVGCYANSKDIHNTIKIYRRAKDIVDPVNLRVIKKSITSNISKDDMVKYLHKEFLENLINDFNYN